MTRTEYNRRWRAAHPEKCAAYTKKYTAKNPELCAARRRAWVDKNKARFTAKQKLWFKANPDRVRAASKRWRENNPDKSKQSLRAYRLRNLDSIRKKARERCQNDPQHRMARRLRCRLYHAIRNQGGKKRDRTAALTGCDFNFLVAHLEAQFKPGMDWPNYGKVWEVDHKRPCASFDLTSEPQQRECFHYSNLQPLHVSDNRKKYAKYEHTYAGSN